MQRLTFLRLYHEKRNIPSRPVFFEECSGRSFFVRESPVATKGLGNCMTPTIDNYSFGHMVIAGTSYSRDVIIFPDKTVLSPWWRRKGHVLAEEDLAGLLAAGVHRIICGTGFMGLLRPAAGLEELLKTDNIEFIAARSSRAVAAYNRMADDDKTGACFHLTC
jgi:hypothetical protein